ncbi:hypothetical protein [Xenophilus sp.]|uniref:hypothetical protein n=1 Tax=Xenophilus sp. TaxID=1873499 RepID=UPI0037DCC2B1
MKAWHYTTGHKAEQIVASGMLMPATAHIGATEEPVVWFSLDQYFELTARKAVVMNGIVRTASLEEMIDHGGGLFRFGAAPRALLCGEALARKARINRATWASLKRVGRSQGADPSLWFGHIGAMPIDGLAFERLDSLDSTWRRA